MSLAKEDTVLLHSLVEDWAEAALRANGAGAFINTTTNASDYDPGDTLGDTILAHSATTPAVGHFFAIGLSSPFSRVLTNILTARASLTVAWEYWDGSSWTALPSVTDPTSSWSVTGEAAITWSVPSDWAETTLSSFTKYWVRARLTAVAGGGLSPRAEYIRVVTASDESQYATPLYPSYETASARSAITGATGRDIYVEWEGEGDDEATVLAFHFNYSNRTYEIRTNKSGELEFVIGSTPTVLLNYGAAVGEFKIGWSTRPNPDTTGASDALISEITIRKDGGDPERWQIKHALWTAPTTRTLSIGGAWVSSTWTRPTTNPPTKVRISRAWHPHVEFEEDWIAARPAYAGTLDDWIAEPLPITVASGLGDAPEFIGRANAGFAAAHSRAVERRAWSPLVNECYRAAQSVTEYLARHMLPMPGSAAYKSSVFSLRWVPVPPGATHAWVRVQVQSWVTGGDAVPVGVRCYAMNRPPTVAIGGLQNQPPPPLDVAYRGKVITENHGSAGTGEWLELGLVRLPVFDAPIPGWRDTVHLCLAYAIDPANASANDAAARLAIHAWNVQPVQQWTPGGMFGG